MWTVFVTELEALRIEMIDKPFWGLFKNPSSTHGPPTPHICSESGPTRIAYVLL